MNELYTIKPTPQNARNLILVSKYFNIDIPENIKLLAEQDRLDLSCYDEKFHEPFQRLIDVDFRARVVINATDKPIIMDFISKHKSKIYHYKTSYQFAEKLEKYDIVVYDLDYVFEIGQPIYLHKNYNSLILTSKKLSLDNTRDFNNTIYYLFPQIKPETFDKKIGLDVELY